MKYISVVILIALMSWTWSLSSTSAQGLSLQQHKQVEAGVEADIRNFIQRRYPNTSEIFCQQLYTEVVQPGAEMLARFRCQAVGPLEGNEETEQVFEGFLRLQSNDGFQTWSEIGGEIRSPEIRFREGIRVTPGNSDQEPSPESAPGTSGEAGE